MSDYIDAVELNNNWVEILKDKELNSLKLKHTKYQLPSILNPSHLLIHNNNLVVIDPANGIFMFSQSDIAYITNPLHWTKLSDIPSELPLGEWSATISNNKIYITIIEPWRDNKCSSPISDDDTANVAIFNLITKTWKYDPESWEKSEECIEFRGSLSTTYDDISDKLHIIDTAKGSHSLFDEKTQLFTTINDMIPFIKEWDSIIYIASISKLYIIGYDHHKVHSVYIDHKNNDKNHDFKNLEWKQHEISIPSETIPVLISGRLLLFWPIGWETMDRSVWFMDVKIDKIYKSDKILPDITLNNIIKTEDDYIIGIDELSNNFIQISLFDLLPHQLSTLNTEKIDKLVAGFVRFIDFNDDQLYQIDHIKNDQADSRYHCVNNNINHSSLHTFNLPLHNHIFIDLIFYHRQIPQDLLYVIRDFVMFIL